MAACLLGGSAALAQQKVDIPYAFPDWQADFPVALEYPMPATAAVYERSRRQALERIVANLQGNVRPQVWQMATEFFWRAPDDAIEPLIAAMDRNFGAKSMKDVVRNTLEAMGKMGREDFDDALRRALEHEDPIVRQAAFIALSTSGKVETIRWAYQFLMQMDGRGRQGWLRAARLRLGSEAVPMFKALMVAETPAPIRDMVLKEVVELPPKDAAVVLQKLWPEAVGEFKAIIAGVLHAAGDSAGTLWLREALRDKNHELVVRALKQLTRGELGVLREEVLMLSTHPRPEVRLGVANLLRMYDGKDIENVYEVLARPDELLEVKCVALKELTRRGRGDMLTALLEDVASVTGTRLEVQLNLLVSSGDDRGVKVFADRFAKCQPGEGREFLRALALCGAPSAAGVLCELFVGPERRIDGKGETTVTYIPVLIPNLRGHEQQLIEFYDKIDPKDHRRRSLWLNTLTSIAADRETQTVRKPIEALLRSVLFDNRQLSQLRVQALNALTRKFLSIDDAMLLKRRLTSEKSELREEPAMRALLKDYLIEYF